MLSLFDDWPHDCDELFWRAYPRKVAKFEAMKSLAKIRAKGNVRFTDLMAALERYKAWLGEANPPKVWRPEPKHAATWLNSGSWNDELPTAKRSITVRSFDDARLKQQFEERAAFEAEQAARKNRPTYDEMRRKYDVNGKKWGIG
jgi:hypothetical protein